MKLIRFEPGEEKPGIQLENGTRVEIPLGLAITTKRSSVVMG